MTPQATPAQVVDNRTAQQRFMDNAAVKLKTASTYVMPIFLVLIGVVIDVWTTMNGAQQGALATSIVGPTWSAVLLGVIAHGIAVFKPAPRGTVSPALQDALNQLAHAQLDAKLKELGQPGLPPLDTSKSITAMATVTPVVVAPTQADTSGNVASPTGFAETQQVELPISQADIVRATLNQMLALSDEEITARLALAKVSKP